MSFNLKRAIGGTMLTALVAGGIALTAAAPATASTTSQAGPVIKTAVQGTGQTDGVSWSVDSTTAPASNATYCAPGYGLFAGTKGAALPSGNAAQTSPSVVTYTFDTPVTSVQIQLGYEFQTLDSAVAGGNGGHEFNYTFGDSSGNAGGTAGFNTVTYTSATPTTTITFTSAYWQNGTCFGAPISVTPAAVDCTAGLTGSVANLNQPARSAVLSGTGKAGETITVTTPNGPVTTVVPANGNWTTTVSNLADGNNALTVNSSDNCAPVALSVIIDPLQVPIMHPAAAAGAAVLGLGAFGFGGLLRRRNTARI